MLLAEETISSDIGKLCFVTQRVCFSIEDKETGIKFVVFSNNYSDLSWIVCLENSLVFYMNAGWHFIFEMHVSEKFQNQAQVHRMWENMFNVRHTRCGFIWPDFFWNPASPTPLLLFCNVVYWKTCSRRHLQKNLFFIPLSSWLWVNY